MSLFDGGDAKKKKLALIFGGAWALWCGFVFSNSLKSREESAAQSATAEGIANRIFSLLGLTDDAGRTAEIIVRKSAHVFEFFVLTVLVYCTLKSIGAGKRAVLWGSAIVGVATACADEFLQIFSERGASVRDVGIDSIGVFLALLAAHFVFKKRRRTAK